MTHNIYLIAGEASGDFIGGGILAELRTRFPDATIHGIGGETMQAAGLHSLFPMQEISLMGFAEILPHIFRLKRRIRETVADIQRVKPDLLITIDSPGFTFRVVKMLARHPAARVDAINPRPEDLQHVARDPAVKPRDDEKPTCIHVVAPTVWAYKPERAAKTAALFDQLLVLLPFEPPYFEKEGLPTTFIGHPKAWEWRQKGDGLAFRARHGIATDATVIGMMPGSRSNELTRHLPIFKDTAIRLQKRYPSLEIIIPIRPAMEQKVRTATRDWPMNVHLAVGDDEKKDAFAACDAALAKSGTISLETVLAGLPTITAFRANPISIWLIRRMVKIPFANLVNIIRNEEIVPEYLQERCTAANLAGAVESLIENDTLRTRQLEAGLDIAAQLGASDTRSPAQKAVDAIFP